MHPKRYLIGILTFLISTHTFASDEHKLICQAEVDKMNSIEGRGKAYNDDFRKQKYDELYYMSDEEFEKERVISNRSFTSKFVNEAGAAMPFWEAVRNHGICMINEMRRIRASKSSISNQPQTNNSNLSQSSDSQQAQQLKQRAQESQQQAQQNQQRVEQDRKGRRRRHEPENEASHCIQPDFGGLYGGMKNTCNFKVWYTYCGYRPSEKSWLTGMNCEKQSFGSDSVSPGRTSASHTKGVQMLYWFACKEPAWTVDTEFVPGSGIRGRCHTVGGN
jgi:hypothetical protein